MEQSQFENPCFRNCYIRPLHPAFAKSQEAESDTNPDPTTIILFILFNKYNKSLNIIMKYLHFFCIFGELLIIRVITQGQDVMHNWQQYLPYVSLSQQNKTTNQQQ